MLVNEVVDAIFGAGLFINAMLFVPQIIRIIKEKSSLGLSKTTFLGFCATQLSAIVYGYLHHDYELMIGYILALLTCGVVTTLIFIYRDN